MEHRHLALKYLAAALRHAAVDDELLTEALGEQTVARLTPDDENAIAGHVIEIGQAMAGEIDALVNQIEHQDDAA